jgi:hypothetical protein
MWDFEDDWKHRRAQESASVGTRTTVCREARRSALYPASVWIASGVSPKQRASTWQTLTENVSNFLQSPVTYQRGADVETDADMVREATAWNREAASRKLDQRVTSLRQHVRDVTRGDEVWVSDRIEFPHINELIPCAVKIDQLCYITLQCGSGNSFLVSWFRISLGYAFAFSHLYYNRVRFLRPQLQRIFR